MGCSPSSIYFATTLVLWLKRSHVLSFDRSSSLAKATALLVLGFSPLSTRLPVVKSSLHSVLRCARNSIVSCHSLPISLIFRNNTWSLVLWNQYLRFPSPSRASSAMGSCICHVMARTPFESWLTYVKKSTPGNFKNFWLKQRRTILAGSSFLFGVTGDSPTPLFSF